MNLHYLHFIVLLLLYACFSNKAQAQSITFTADKSTLQVGDTLVWTYALPGTKDSFSDFKMETLEGIRFLDTLGTEETTVEETNKTERKAVLIKAETKYRILVCATTAGRFDTGSATALWHNGTLIRSAPQTFTIGAKRDPKK